MIKFQPVSRPERMGLQRRHAMPINGLKRGEKPALVISECQRAMIDRAFVDRNLSQQVHERQMVPKIAALAAVGSIFTVRSAARAPVDSSLVERANAAGSPRQVAVTGLSCTFR